MAIGSELTLRLRMTSTGLEVLDQVGRRAREAVGGLTPMQARVVTLNQALQLTRTIFHGIERAGRLAAAAIGSVVESSVSWESAFAGVRKTVDATDLELEGISEQLRKMATEIPVAATELAKVAESAGQLGIRKDAIAGFTRVMADLGVSTNLSADQAADSLARLANITQLPQEKFENLGSAVVALGNNLAATESEIVTMGLRLAGAGKQIGLSEGQILGFAGALSSVGIEAEAGGSAFSRLFIKMAAGVAAGGEQLETFARVAGSTATDFAEKFGTNAAGAVADFIEGLGKISATGQNTFGIIEELGLKEIRLRDAILRTSNAGDLLRNSLELGNKAFAENTVLAKEAGERYKTTESQLTVLNNTWTEFKIQLGDTITKSAEFQALILTLTESFKLMAGFVQENRLALTDLVGGGITFAIQSFGVLLVMVQNVVKAFEYLNALRFDNLQSTIAKVTAGESLTPWADSIGAAISKTADFQVRFEGAAASIRAEMNDTGAQIRKFSEDVHTANLQAMEEFYAKKAESAAVAADTVTEAYEIAEEQTEKADAGAKAFAETAAMSSAVAADAVDDVAASYYGVAAAAEMAAAAGAGIAGMNYDPSLVGGTAGRNYRGGGSGYVSIGVPGDIRFQQRSGGGLRPAGGTGSFFSGGGGTGQLEANIAMIQAANRSALASENLARSFSTGAYSGFVSGTQDVRNRTYGIR